MLRASPGLPCDIERREQRRYLFDMLEQLAALAVSCVEKEVADVLYALVAVYGEEREATVAAGEESCGTASA